MMLYKVFCHGVDHPNYIVCAENGSEAVRICADDVKTTFDEPIGECNVCKIGCVTADITHLYPKAAILMRGI